MDSNQRVHFESLKRVRDSLTVQVRDGNIDAALKALRHGVQEAGTLKALHIRKNHPRPQDRARYKAMRAAARRLKGVGRSNLYKRRRD